MNPEDEPRRPGPGTPAGAARRPGPGTPAGAARRPGPGTPAGVLTEAFGRVLESATATLQDLDEAQLAHRPTADANSIAWLLWHLTRVQDDHVADAFDVEQVYTERGYAERFAEHFPHPADDTGYGHSSAQVAAVRAPAGLFLEYLQAVHDRTVRLLTDVTAEQLERVVDERWDPPVTLGVRLVSVLHDDLEHAGQAAYVKGLLPAGS